MDENIERKVLIEGHRIALNTGAKHRIARQGNEVYIEISNNGHEGFMQFSVPVTYYRFAGTSVWRSPVPNAELARYN